MPFAIDGRTIRKWPFSEQEPALVPLSRYRLVFVWDLPWDFLSDSLNWISEAGIDEYVTSAWRAASDMVPQTVFSEPHLPRKVLRIDSHWSSLLEMWTHTRPRVKVSARHTGLNETLENEKKRGRGKEKKEKENKTQKKRNVWLAP